MHNWKNPIHKLHKLVWCNNSYSSWPTVTHGYPLPQKTKKNRCQHRPDQIRWNTNFNLELTLVQPRHKTAWASRLTLEVAFTIGTWWWWWWSLVLQMQSSQKDPPSHPATHLPSIVISELWSPSDLKSRPPNNTLGSCICIHPKQF